MLHNHPQKEHTALIVDLDQTLIRGDLAMEALVGEARKSVWMALRLFWLMLSGRSRLKAYLARIAPVQPENLRFNEDVLLHIHKAKNEGCRIILASAAHQRNVTRISRHLGLFDKCIGTTARYNLKSANKLAAIRSMTNDSAFDYIGDCAADMPIWKASRCAYTVGISTGLEHEQRLGAKPISKAHALLIAARPHQLAKNALVFVPLVSSGLLLNMTSIIEALICFVSLSLVASGVYLLNDLLDISADRKHINKQHRPLASGALSIPYAFVASLFFVAMGLGMSLLLLSSVAFAMVSTYFVMTVAYSFRLKSAMILDVMVLACLYTMRIIAGSAAIGVATSFWLLLFSIFFFLSLGYLKRYIELLGSKSEQSELLSGRGYIPIDSTMVAMSGISSGMVSMLVILLFIEEMAYGGDYALPELLWLLVLPLLYWFNRIWLMAQRGQVDGDPVAFALKDKRSMLTGATVAILFIAAKFGLPYISSIGSVG